ncbi:glycosyl transferase, partial [Bacillus cereus]
MKKAKGENILLLNNDIVVTKNWLKNLLTCLYAEKDTAAVGPVTNNASYYSAIPTFYTNIEEMQKFASEFNQSDRKKW